MVESDDSSSFQRNFNKRKTDIEDPEVKKLAEDIINAQRNEIGEMKEMIKRLENDK